MSGSFNVNQNSIAANKKYYLGLFGSSSCFNYPGKQLFDLMIVKLSTVNVTINGKKITACEGLVTCPPYTQFQFDNLLVSNTFTITLTPDSLYSTRREGGIMRIANDFINPNNDIKTMIWQDAETQRADLSCANLNLVQSTPTNPIYSSGASTLLLGNINTALSANYQDTLVMTATVSNADGTGSGNY